jgi:flagellar hook-length control protein FliK
MTLARVEKRTQSDAIQGVTPAAAATSAHADLLAEFSSLVEKIAGQVQTTQGNPDFTQPLDAPKAKKTPVQAREEAPEQGATEAASPAAQNQVVSEETEVTEQEARPGQDSDSEKELSDQDEQTTERESQEGVATTADASDASQTQVQVATAAASTAATSEAAKVEAPKSEEILASESHEELGVEVDSVPAQEAKIPTSGQRMNERAPKGELAQTAAAHDKSTPSASDPVTAHASSTKSARINSPEENATQGGEQLVAESTARALKNLLAPTQATSPSMRPRSEVLDRDAMLSALIVKPLIDQQLRGADAVKSAPMNNQVQGIDAAALKSTASRSSSNEAGARSARNLARVNSDRLLEKVEGALKEVARSKDGSSLSFRLDPPQLGSVRVDVTLRDGGLHARVIPDNPQVAQLMKERAHELQQNLRNLGLNVETVSVSVGGESFSDNLGADQSSLSGENGSRGDRNAGREGQSAGAAMGTWAESAVKATEDHWVA